MSKGAFVPGKYLIWFMNGCDTFAYVDRSLANRRALLNADDPGGTKYMDTVTNVMAGYFRSLGPTSLTLLRALVDARDRSAPPKTYEQIFQSIDPVAGRRRDRRGGQRARSPCRRPPTPPETRE